VSTYYLQTRESVGSSLRNGSSITLRLATRLSWLPADRLSCGLSITLGLTTWLTWLPADGLRRWLGDSLGDSLGGALDFAAGLTWTPADRLGLTLDLLGDLEIC